MSNVTKKTIIVPWDFTERSEIALEHAYQLAQVVGDNILLVSLLRQPCRLATRASQHRFDLRLEELRGQLDDEAHRLKRRYDERQRELSLVMEQEQGEKRRELHDVSIMTLAMAYRNLRKAFKDVYTSMDINLVVARQFYNLEGGKKVNLVSILKRLKLGRANTMPFIIVNNPPTHRYYTELVVPMDSANSYKETLRWVAYLSNYYHCNVNLMKPSVRDDRRKKGMANNLYFTKKILDAKGVVYGIKTASRRNDFRTEIFKFTKTIDADLLIIMTDKMKAYFTKDLVDVEMPVMFINPLSKRYQAFY